MDQRLPRTPLTLDVVGQPVATLTALRRIANQLTAIQGIWFAVEPWPEGVAEFRSPIRRMLSFIEKA